jgi:tripartite-type tricarboxylate transporter receptor subunit TctC
MRIGLVFLTAAIVFTLGTQPKPVSSSDAWPTKAVSIYVGYPVGTPADLEGRQLAQGLRKVLGQPVVVVDVPGGNAEISLKDILELPADGYSYLFVTKDSTYPWANPKTSYPVSDFQAIAELTAEATSFYVRSDSPFKTLPDLVDYARKNPGRLTVSTFGTLSALAQDVAKLETAAKIDLKCVPYGGGPAQVAAVLGGHADAGLGTTSNFYNLTKAGKIRILAVASPVHPYPFLPDVPTLSQYGYDFTDFFWRGIVARRGTPDDFVQRMAQAIKGVTTTQEWKDYEQRQVQVGTYAGPVDFGKTLVNDVDEARRANPAVCGK